MFIITLTLTELAPQAKAHMDAHNVWIAQGFDDGVFVLVGSLAPQGGGAILARGDDMQAITARVHDDPFVANGFAKAHIQQVTPARADASLAILTGAAA